LDVALTAAKGFLSELPAVPPGDLTRVYLHWSAEEYHCTDASYHAVVALSGDAWEIAYTHDVRKNAKSTFSEVNYAEATAGRNRGSCAIAIDGLIGKFSPSDFGSEPIQMHEVEYLCAGAAAFCVRYGIDALGHATDDDVYGGAFYGEPTILTHSEAANMVGVPPQYAAYGPAPIGTSERIDLACLVPAPPGEQVTPTHAYVVGTELRARIHAYAQALKG
jgi:hypothetical protein